MKIIVLNNNGTVTKQQLLLGILLLTDEQPLIAEIFSYSPYEPQHDNTNKMTSVVSKD